jgi:energy-coupling factor transporter ATP-binding protein EcfA2
VTYDDGTEAVRGVSLDVEAGEFFGFLGPNGAGKTTTIKTLLTLLYPTRGSVRINGYDTRTEPQDVREADQYLQTGLFGIVGILVVTVMFGGVFMAYSNVVALVTRDREATVMIANLLTFPLLFTSSAFLPLEVLPDWIQAVAVANPITYGVDGIRASCSAETCCRSSATAFAGLWNTVVPGSPGLQRRSRRYRGSPSRAGLQG